MSLNESLSGDVANNSPTTDFKGRTVGQNYLQQINETNKDLNFKDVNKLSTVQSNSRLLGYSQADVDRDRASLRAGLKANTKNSYSAIYDTSRNGVINQSGLRHAIALEKLMNSNDSQDSILKGLREMAQVSEVSGFDNVLDRTGESFNAYQQNREVFGHKRKSISYRASVNQISPLRQKAQLGMVQRKGSLQPIIRTKRREEEGSLPKRRSMLSPY